MKKKVLKILAAIGILLYVIGFIFVAKKISECFITKSEAKNIVEKYIAKKYKGKDYYVDEVSFYPFRKGAFDVRIRSKSSKDSEFPIDLNSNGELVHDYYEEYVEERYNTTVRINGSYDKLVTKAFSKKNVPFKVEFVTGEIMFTSKKYKEQVLEYMKESGKGVEDSEIYREMNYDSYYLISDELELDKKYNVRKLGKKAGCISITIIDKKASVKKAAEYMLKVKDHLDEKNIPFYAIDFRLWYSENYREKYASKYIDVLNFYYKDIEEKGLEKRIKRRMEANK